MLKKSRLFNYIEGVEALVLLNLLQRFDFEALSNASKRARGAVELVLLNYATRKYAVSELAQLHSIASKLRVIFHNYVAPSGFKDGTTAYKMYAVNSNQRRGSTLTTDLRGVHVVQRHMTTAIDELYDVVRLIDLETRTFSPSTLKQLGTIVRNYPLATVLSKLDYTSAEILDAQKAHGRGSNQGAAQLPHKFKDLFGVDFPTGVLRVAGTDEESVALRVTVSMTARQQAQIPQWMQRFPKAKGVPELEAILKDLQEKLTSGVECTVAEVPVAAQNLLNEVTSSLADFDAKHRAIVAKIAKDAADKEERKVLEALKGLPVNVKKLLQKNPGLIEKL